MDINQYLKNIQPPEPSSHKGQNGKLLIIGGSELFHAASKWSLDIASKFVDMVFYSSVPINNELIKEAKQEFWNGIVVDRDNLNDYVEEADAILIGPGMERSEDTREIVSILLSQYSTKKWVVDAGALQMVSPRLLGETCIITPHQQELRRLVGEVDSLPFTELVDQGVTVLLKGEVDSIFHQDRVIEVTGGNAGMTKGGTGDVLAGLVAALYCTHDAVTSAVVGSYINKKAGEYLHQTVGPYFNASDLVRVIPEVLWSELQK